MRIQTRLFLGTAALVLALMALQWWLYARQLRGEPPLHAASLGSPIFVESWNGGSPLNWVEFMGRWETTRIDHHSPKQDD